ncbi:YsnF/AvaK domain-containing protein [Frigoribacterium endophyticum]|uniref:YsnF/AvaK domain-containing protein n=1 Tax=Frigoribacterium endophyticum TaxID=1522176 RepID=UPI0014229B95|nr:YsnF/AvaK domain-containing protein [Frigoribacterium endophyticum]NII52136.1 uncharacterized protein (TIGR02271 family) [Frigoribacterium endophyticum]
MTSPSVPTPPRPQGTQEVILSEEHVVVSTERRVTERVRLQRVIVTEQRTITVDVSHEEMRLVREPFGPDAEPGAVPAVADRQPIVMVLHEERVSLVRSIVPVERVTLSVRDVTETTTVTKSVRREEASVDVD